MKKYRQCKLIKTVENGQIHLVSYIPEKFAVEGKIVKLKNEFDEWEEGWKVESAGQLVDEDFLPDFHKEIKAHRKNTGDAMPKMVK